MPVPEWYGGAGADVTTAAVLVGELARRFPSLTVEFVLLSIGARLVEEVGTSRRTISSPAWRSGTSR
ncbi:MAG: acyl-CoA dehydrogenase family protein [Actinomycetia bacterium]|nr:acyl-CoA dehydrogenase family protein [Actinomycetes bacterium]